MQRIHAGLIQVCRQLGHALGTVHLHEQATLYNMEHTLQETLQSTPGVLPELAALLALSVTGLQTLRQRALRDPQRLADAVATALAVAEQCLLTEHHPDRELPVQAAASELQSALGPEPLVPLPDTETSWPHAGIVEATSEPLPVGVEYELLGDFITECREHVQHIEVALLTLESNSDDSAAIDTTFRAFHTIKGTAAFLHLTRIADLAHHTESLLSRMRDGVIRCTGGYADLALQAADMLKAYTQALQDVLGGAALVTPPGLDDLLQVLADPEAVGVSAHVDTMAPPPPRLGDILVAEGKVDRQDVEAVAADCSGFPLGVALLRAGTASLPDVAHALRTQRRLMGSEVTVEPSMRVRLEHLDRLVDMIGALVIAHAMVAQDEAILHSGSQTLRTKLTHVSTLVCALQDLSMAMRLVPLKTTFQKMLRVVRDVAHKSGKLVDLRTAGEETEIDRNIIEMITDPLMHMVRNAVDHGLETPEVRERLGKPRIGIVQLRAYHTKGKVVIELQDDGRGLDCDKIVQKAVAQGLISSAQGLAEPDIFRLIFAPGFSTADRVTDISGRGVGLDVVRQSIEALHGHIAITSQVGQGTTCVLSLPLALVLIDGMVVQVSRERYIIPLAFVSRSFRPPAAALSIGTGEEELVIVHGERLPLVRLYRLFDVAGAITDPTRGCVVVVHDGQRRYALLVDALLGRQQVVAKPLGPGLDNIVGIAGAAILGDGCVGLLLDLAGIVVLARQMPAVRMGIVRDSAA
jgi:two-component system, chemotaxis family, sensor kinase CheA